ncbi:MAG: hypothetical protein HY593_06225 [Candidatus Omnitrophica bacterium]|nr:hypothetical protein [Candidatus Omnitrophota bacterium]
MGKRVFPATLTAVCLFSFSAFAASSSVGPIDISATVSSSLSLNVKVVDQATNQEVSSLDFGQLKEEKTQSLAQTSFKVLIKVGPGNGSLQLTQTGTPLTHEAGSAVIPEGAFAVKPTYDAADNSGASQPEGSTVGAAGTAVGTRTLYSDPTGSERVVTLLYTLSGDPSAGAAEVIPAEQKSGAYSGAVQFTVTTV